MLENWVGAALRARRPAPPVAGPAALAPRRRGVGRSTKLDKSYRVFASERRIRFTEMEYGIPREHAAEAVRRVLEHRRPARAPGRVPDRGPLRRGRRGDAQRHLRPRTCYIAVHQDHRIDWQPYFRGVEEIMDSYGGRPHWGKRHSQTAETLAPRYPRWADFQALRDRLDPDGRFRNPYTDRVLG